jgi:TonB family protein
VSQEVHRILAARSRRASRRPEAVSLGAAFLLHALAIAAALILPSLQPKPEPLQFVPVQVIPAQALGVRRPAPPRQKPAEEEAPRPAEPEPEPPAQEEPEPEVAPPPPEPDDDVPVLPREEPKKPEPKKPEPRKPEPRATAPKSGEETRPPQRTPPTDAPPGVAPGESGDQLGRRGAATGTPLGTTAFGSRIGVDNPEFTYGYYLDRLLSLIDAQWQRPNMGEVQAIVHFSIARDGSISDLRVAESSGYNSFDYAALRAVQNAAPFPPLPRGYRGDSLGVNLIVH